jgi:hypothetical protein
MSHSGEFRILYTRGKHSTSCPRRGLLPINDRLPLQEHNHGAVAPDYTESISGIVTRDGWKYVCFENHSWLQFNLNEYPYEEMNLSQLDRYRPERKKLIAQLRQWGAETGDRFATPED